MPRIDNEDQARRWLGDEIGRRRARLGLTQQELADGLGVTVKTVNSIENGRSGMRKPTASRIEQELAWPAGTVDNIRRGMTGPREDAPHIRVPAKSRTQDAPRTPVTVGPSAYTPPPEVDLLTPAQRAVLDELIRVMAYPAGATIPGDLHATATTKAGLKLVEPGRPASDEDAVAARIGTPDLDRDRAAQDEAAEASQDPDDL